MRRFSRDRATSDCTLWDYLPDPIWISIFLLIPAAWIAAARLLGWWIV